MNKNNMINLEKKIIDDINFLNTRYKIYDFMYDLLNSLYNYIKKNNIKTIIGIGDSPTIFLNILQLNLKKIKKHNNINIKYFPISSIKINCKSCDKILQLELNKINNFKLKGPILWIDFIATGETFNLIYNNLPKTIKNKSYFFLYGFQIDKKNKINILFEKLNKTNKLFYLKCINNIENVFLGSIIGWSEKYKIRCIKHTKLDNNYEIKFYDNIDDIKIKKNINDYKHCKDISNFFFENLIRRFGKLF